MWSVGRTIRTGKREDFRKELRDSQQFDNALRDKTGCKLSRLEPALRRRFGTQSNKLGKRKSIGSALSKLAAFAKPECFVAWDQFARKGVKATLGRGKFTQFTDHYAAYLKAFNEIWDGPHGQRVRTITEKVIGNPLGTDLRFQRRVLDLYLMALGGWKEKPSKPGVPRSAGI